MEVADEIEAVLKVCLKLDVACLVEIGASAVAVVVASWTDGAHAKGAYAVSSAHVEEFAVGGNGRIAVSPDESCLDACGKAALLAESIAIAQLYRCFQELGVWAAEECFAFGIEISTCERHCSANEVS